MTIIQSLGILWSYNGDEVNYDANKIIANQESKTTTSTSFENKIEITGKTLLIIIH